MTTIWTNPISWIVGGLGLNTALAYGLGYEQASAPVTQTNSLASNTTTSSSKGFSLINFDGSGVLTLAAIVAGVALLNKKK